MAIAFVAAAGTNTDAWETSVGVTLDAGTAADRWIVGLFGHQGSDATADIAASDITVGGSASGVVLASASHLMTFGGNEIWRWFHIQAPASGSATLTVNDPDNVGRRLVLIASAYTGIGSIRATPAYGTQAYNNAPDITVTSATGEEVVSLIHNYDLDSATLTPGTGSSLLTGISTGNQLGLREDGAASVTIGGTWPGSRARIYAAFSLQAAAAAASDIATVIMQPMRPPMAWSRR
jgi:hypothetical protein